MKHVDDETCPTCGSNCGQCGRTGHKLPVVLDQGLIDLDNYEASKTAMLVRQVRSLLLGISLPCGYPGCSYCDLDYRWEDDHPEDYEED